MRPGVLEQSLPSLAHSDAPPQDGRASLSAQSGNGAIITPMRRFPPPWIVEEHAESFIVKDATGQALGYFYFEDEPGQRLAAKLPTRDKAGRNGHQCGERRTC